MEKGVVEKCLAFCQALSNNNQVFSFSLTIGSDNFNFDLKELAKSSCVKKKKSPSQLRREKKRREERKQAATSTKAEEDAAEVSSKSFANPRCDPCETTFSSEEELSAHNESAHKKLFSPEKEHGIASHCELQLSPIHVQRDEENISEQESEPLVCDLSWPGYCDSKCRETFSCENDLRVHVHLSHMRCFRERYSTPCPWEHCISNEKS